MKKYICWGGSVIAKDGDKHFISASKLCILFNVASSESILINSKYDISLKLRGLNQSDFIHLHPDPIGKYKVGE